MLCDGGKQVGEVELWDGMKYRSSLIQHAGQGAVWVVQTFEIMFRSPKMISGKELVSFSEGYLSVTLYCSQKEWGSICKRVDLPRLRAKYGKDVLLNVYTRYWPFNRQIIQLEFSPTWSCVSLTRSTTSSEWKLFRFDKMEVNYF